MIHAMVISMDNDTSRVCSCTIKNIPKWGGLIGILGYLIRRLVLKGSVRSRKNSTLYAFCSAVVLWGVMDSKDVLGALRFDVRLEFVRGEGRVVVGLESLNGNAVLSL